MFFRAFISLLGKSDYETTISNQPLPFKMETPLPQPIFSKELIKLSLSLSNVTDNYILELPHIFFQPQDIYNIHKENGIIDLEFKRSDFGRVSDFFQL